MNIVKELPAIFEEFSEQEKQSYLKIKEYKEKGIPVIGSYCSFFPREIATAMGAISVGLCSSSETTVAIAEQTLPQAVCPIIKSSYGFAVSDKCPYFYFSDLVVGETTCDGKKKMYEMLGEFKDVYVLELPTGQSKDGLKLWRSSIIKFKEYLEEKFQIVITEDNIRNAIRSENLRRKSIRDFYELMRLDPVPMTGVELLDVLYGFKYKFDVDEAVSRLNQLTDGIRAKYESEEKREKKPRILITGCPMGKDTKKLVHAIENNGGIVVAFENCTGAKTISQMVDEEKLDVYEAIAEKYLNIGCAVMTPNDNRITMLGEMVDEFKVDGVVEMSLFGCHSVLMETVNIRNFIHEEKHIGYINITTDFSESDVAQINTRVAAFIEMINTKKNQTK